LSASLEGRIDIRLTRHGDAVTDVEIHSSRPQLAQKLMAGRGPEEAADLAGLIFSLCGKAQKVAAQAACEAARGLPPSRDALKRREHKVRVELAQEHAWRLLLNWPEQSGRGADMPSLLLLRQKAEDPLAFADVLENLLGAVLLGESPGQWLARDLAGFDIWRRDGRSLVAKLFADLGDGPDPGVSRCALLPPLAKLDTDPATDLARRALADPAFCAAPLWHGAPAETGALARMADSLPAYGIVAAVMGVVHTMESLHLPPSELGILIAHALVGTFLGILLSYGFVAPLATVLEGKAAESTKVYQTVKVILLSSLNGFAPQTCAEFGRKVLFSTERPSFRELEEDIKARKGK